MIPESMEFLVLGREKLIVVASMLPLATIGKLDVSIKTSPDDSTNILVKSTSFEDGVVVSSMVNIVCGDITLCCCCCWLRCDTCMQIYRLKYHASSLM